MARTVNKSSVWIEKVVRSDGQDRYRARWYRPDTGKPVAKIIGVVSDFATPEALESARVSLEKEVNRIPRQADTIAALINEFIKEELVIRSDNTSRGFSYSYVDRTTAVLKGHIEPVWGERRIKDVGKNPKAIRNWLDGLKREDGEPLANATKAKIKITFQCLFKYAIFSGRFDGVNPLTTFTQSAKRQFRPGLLTPAQLHALVERLGFRERLLVLLASTTGLRRSELSGLKWQDVDWFGLKLNIARSVVDNIEGCCKTEASASAVYLDESLAATLKTWYQMARFNKPDHYVFAADQNRPLRLSKLFQYHIQPAAKELAVNIRAFGWHTFRRCYITWLAAEVQNPKVVQELARHSNVATTMNVYAQVQGDEPLKAAHSKGLTKLHNTLVSLRTNLRINGESADLVSH